MAGALTYEYTPQVALRICEKVAQGETLSDILQPGVGLPSRATFYRWLIQYPELARAYSTAREMSAFSMDEEALDLAREIRRNPGTAIRVRAYEVAMNQLRWSATRRNPKVFSDRAAISLTVPIQINTGLDLGQGSLPSVVGPDGKTISEVDIYKVEAKVPQTMGDVAEETPLPPKLLSPPQQRPGKRPLRPEEIAKRQAEAAQRHAEKRLDWNRKPDGDPDADGDGKVE